LIAAIGHGLALSNSFAAIVHGLSSANSSGAFRFSVAQVPRFWAVFGSPKITKFDQNRSKIMIKNQDVFVRFLLRFGRHVGSFLGTQIDPKST
jgi:hypothetical protein